MSSMVLGSSWLWERPEGRGHGGRLDVRRRGAARRGRPEVLTPRCACARARCHDAAADPAARPGAAHGRQAPVLGESAGPRAGNSPRSAGRGPRSRGRGPRGSEAKPGRGCRRGVGDRGDGEQRGLIAQREIRGRRQEGKATRAAPACLPPLDEAPAAARRRATLLLQRARCRRQAALQTREAGRWRAASGRVGFKAAHRLRAGCRRVVGCRLGRLAPNLSSGITHAPTPEAEFANTSQDQKESEYIAANTCEILHKYARGPRFKSCLQPPPASRSAPHHSLPCPTPTPAPAPTPSTSHAAAKQARSAGPGAAGAGPSHAASASAPPPPP